MRKLNKNDIMLFIVLCCFSCIIFNGYLKEHYSADTFMILNKGYENYAIGNSLLDGRIFMYIIGILAYKSDFSIVLYAIILELLAIIVTCINVIILKNIVIKYKKISKTWQNIFLIIVCYYTLFNYTYIDNMYFVECFVMSLSMLFYLLAAKEFTVKDRINYFKIISFVFLGLISYQGTISAFFIFTFVFSMLNEKKVADILKDLARALLCFIIAFIPDYLCIRITEKIFNIVQIRESNIHQMFFSIRFLISNFLGILIKTSNLFPKYLYIIFVISIGIIVTIKIVKQNNKEYNKQNQIILFEQFFIIIAGIIFAFIPSIYSLTAFNSARIRFSLGAIVGLLFIHLITKTDILELKVKFDKILIGIFILYGIINSINYLYLINLNNWTNELDKKSVKEIENYIERYENDSSINVKNIAIVIVPKNIEKAYYKQMNCNNTGVAVSAVRTNWAAQGIINYYTKKNLQKKECALEEIKTYAEKVDEDKGYLCIGDTLYISVYWY